MFFRSKQVECFLVKYFFSARIPSFQIKSDCLQFFQNKSCYIDRTIDRRYGHHIHIFLNDVTEFNFTFLFTFKPSWENFGNLRKTIILLFTCCICFLRSMLIIGKSIISEHPVLGCFLSSPPLRRVFVQPGFVHNL